MRNKLLIFILAIFVPIFFSCLHIILNLPIQIIQDCDLRKTTIPEFPIYPDSSLLSEIDVLNYSSATVLEYIYNSHASPTEILQFYATYATCYYYPSRQQHICEGDAKMFGSFSVFINDEHSDLTSEYSLKLSWNKCGADGDEINSVER